MKKTFFCILLTLCMILGGITAAVSAVSDRDLAAAAASAEPADYGLADTCADGNILHCFNWTLNQIKAELPNIAAAGFTSVQTSPLQGHDGQNQWYWLYQPTNFSVGNELGSYEDLEALCTEAHRYGVKVIVDVVANHLAGQKSGTWSTNIDSSLKKSEYFHNQGACTDNDNRYDLTHKNIGMPDLNTENADIQSKVAALVASLKSAGVDGIRWDAAKHIGLPSEDCTFWQNVPDADMYNYGEILDAPAGRSSDEVNDALIAEYTQYIGVTDEPYSATITGAIRDGRVAKSKGNWVNRGVSSDRIVYWAESHDTYGNNEWTNGLDQNVIDRAYAILGARANSQALYLSRPFEKSHTAIRYAKKGSTHFTSPEVAAVNRFHNAMNGSGEKYFTSSGCYVVCRGGGAVIVSPTSADVTVTVTNGDGMVPEGVYTDEVSGTTWTVTASAITGQIGSTGIAVIYDHDYVPGQVLLGDADLSGGVTILDATAIQRTLASLEVPSFDEKSADADGDGKVSILDATAIQRWLANLPCNENIGKMIAV